MTPKNADWAYAAGIVDGDGTITGSMTQLYIQICVSMVGKEVQDWLSSIFGGRQYVEKNYRQMHTWRIGGPTAKNFLEGVFPYLKLKQRQAAVALEFVSTQRGRGRGKGRTDEEINHQQLLMRVLFTLNQEGKCGIL